MRRFSSSRLPLLVFILIIILYYWLLTYSPPEYIPQRQPKPQWAQYSWHARKERYPISSSFMMPPSGNPVQIPPIQHSFKSESRQVAKLNRGRREAVKSAFVRGWKGYKEHAWNHDELKPVSGGSQNNFGGWAATLVDSLDTLWIMDLKKEFKEAVRSVGEIDFTRTDAKEINVFETTIRYLGGMLSAYDLSKGKYPLLLEKSLELGEMLYAAFDTPNRMPITRWTWRNARDGLNQDAEPVVFLAEIGSLSLEFTRLSQLSEDPKFFDAVQRIYDVFEAQQSLTEWPGLWPLALGARDTNFTEDNSFTFGAMADSMYEYLPKQFMLLGGLSTQPRKLYEAAIEAAKQLLFFRPMTQDGRDILLSGNAKVEGPKKFTLEAQGQHLTCFIGGMMAIASQIFSRPDDLLVARKIVNGCIWAYDIMPTGIMPEAFHAVPCDDPEKCSWDPAAWHNGIMRKHNNVNQKNMEEMIESLRLPPGIIDISDRRYLLRPEAIESMFILYRITGDESLRESAWNMFQTIDNHTKTEYGNTALEDITTIPPMKGNSMESFWTAETLKYFYLIFSPPDVVSLDEFVFNTEAHPLKRPR